jgi:hypothetical protein
MRTDLSPFVREGIWWIADSEGRTDGASERDRTSDLLITNELLHMLEKVSRA